MNDTDDSLLNTRVDKPVFSISLIVLLAVTSVLLIQPERSLAMLQSCTTS